MTKYGLVADRKLRRSALVSGLAVASLLFGAQVSLAQVTQNQPVEAPAEAPVTENAPVEAPATEAPATEAPAGEAPSDDAASDMPRDPDAAATEDADDKTVPSGPPAEPAPEPDPISAQIGREGLKATAKSLAALPDPTDAQRFALAGVQFLSGVESALQLRWQMDLSTQVSDLPLLRLPLPPNPDPKPFRPESVKELFVAVDNSMIEARKALVPLGKDDFGLTIALDDLWFDIDSNGVRDDSESLMPILTSLMGGIGVDDQAQALPVVRFDRADADWLLAYTHMLSGVSSVVQAYDPTEAIARVTEARKKFGYMTAGEMYGMYVPLDFVDAAAVIVRSLRGQPNVEKATRAKSEFLAMFAANKSFWKRVETETDNQAEWIPNARQQSAMGIELPPETGEMWQAVLTEGEDILNGRTLLPFWRGNFGINVGRMFTDPRPIDLIDWFQGAGALPYLESGKIASFEAARRFGDLFYGNGMLVSLWLN
ncbi:hypothetical protein [Paracoccus pacificus]|uniref:Uncharacterized protein n=1 Tax=Paracoccus pacificus TaxID=1463598 RepID=A0ABW4R6R4_9RHOB